MNRRCEALSIVAASALALTLVSASNAASLTPARPAVTISNPGNEDYVGFRIVVEPSGQVRAVDAAGQASRLLMPDVIDRFYADLNAASPLANKPGHPCSAATALETTTVDLNGAVAIASGLRKWSGLNCATDSRAAALLSDAIAIQRALYVQVYRERTIARFNGDGATYGGYVASGQATVNYTGPPNAYGSSGASSSGYGFGALNLGGISMGSFGSGLPYGSPYSGSISGSYPSGSLPTSGISGGLPGGSLPGSAPSGSLPGGSPYGGSPFNGSPYSSHP